MIQYVVQLFYWLNVESQTLLLLLDMLATCCHSGGFQNCTLLKPAQREDSGLLSLISPALVPAYDTCTKSLKKWYNPL